MKWLVTATLVLLAGCSASSSEERSTEAWSQVPQDEAIRFGGTEPFWGGEVTGTRLTYTTPDNPDGTVITVARFAGNSGASFSGELDGKSFDLMITQGSCSDGMSDRTYPLNATLKLGGEVLSGCAHSDSLPFEGPEMP